MLKEVSMKTLQRTKKDKKTGETVLCSAWAVAIYYGDKVISHIPLCVAVSKKELLMLEDDIKAYNILKDKIHDKECYNYCVDLLRYFRTINYSKAKVENAYVRESYMGLIGKHAIEQIMMHAIALNAIKIKTSKKENGYELETVDLKETFDCVLYKKQYYVTRCMIETLLKNMVSKMQDWQLNNFERTFKLNLLEDKEIQMLANYIFDNFIVLDKDINCKELVFITDCLKAYKHETVF